MKKSLFLILISSLLIVLPLTGCVKNRPSLGKTHSSTVEQSSTSVSAETSSHPEGMAPLGEKATKSSTTENTLSRSEANAKAEEAYMDFLNGKTKVTTAEQFREDDADLNYDGLLYGTYSFDEMKAAITEFEGNELNAFYGFVDCAQDGITQLILRFESSNDSFMNWIAVITLGKSSLELNYAYEDGYRVKSSFYTSGHLVIEGSMGAGAYHARLMTFDSAGSASEVFSINTYFGTYASSIVYNLAKNNTDYDLTERFDSLENSELRMREYIGQGATKLAVDEWSKDEATRAEEESFVADLVKMGATVISSDEMDKLASFKPYESDLVTMKAWGSSVTSSEASTEASTETAINENISTEVYVDYASDEQLSGSTGYLEFIGDTSEHQVKLVINADSKISNATIMGLELADYNEGKMVFNVNEEYTLGYLEPNERFVLGTSFPGDYALHGLRYTDANGQAQTKAIVMSGMDGSVSFTDAIFK